MTIFDVFQYAAAVAGLLLVGLPAAGRFGLIGAIVGGVVGLVGGWVVGSLPFALCWVWTQRSLRRTPSAELRRRVGEQWFYAHLLIAELVRRGEPIDDLRPVIKELMASESSQQQYFARRTAGIWFPELLKDAP